MPLVDSYPVIVTPRLMECRDFYRRWLDAEIVFEASWFVLLSLPGGQGYRVAFMTPDHPSSPPGPEAFSGRGVFLTLQVDDAQAENDRLTRIGAPIAYPLRTERWGQVRFALIDPAGTWIDVVQQVEPQPGFWDPYLSG